MEFNAHKPIYLQICSQLYEQILRGELKADDRILSVRDYGIQLGVNPNTIMRSYETMTASGDSHADFGAFARAVSIARTIPV